MKQGVGPLLPAGDAAQGHDQLQGHAHAGQILEGIGAVFPVGVHHGDGVRELFFAFVVVGDDHVHAQAGGVSRLGQGGDAAVHGDALQRQLLHGLVVHAVALGEPVGDVIAHVAPL